MTASQIWWKDQSAEFYEVIPKHSPSPRTVWCLTTNSTSIAERVAPYVCLIPPCWLSPANVNELGRWDEASDIIPKQYLTCFTPGLNKRQTLDNSYSPSKCPFYIFCLQSCSLTSGPWLRTPPPSSPKRYLLGNVEDDGDGDDGKIPKTEYLGFW